MAKKNIFAEAIDDHLGLDGALVDALADDESAPPAAPAPAPSVEPAAPASAAAPAAPTEFPIGTPAIHRSEWKRRRALELGEIKPST